MAVDAQRDGASAPVKEGIMAYTAYMGMRSLGEVDEAHVLEIAQSIMANGWVGAPILHMGMDQLVTGSHRLGALALLDEMYEDGTSPVSGEMIVRKYDVFHDVSDLYDAYIERLAEELECETWEVKDTLEFDNLSKYFAGTRVEKWADEIVEWY